MNMDERSAAHKADLEEESGSAAAVEIRRLGYPDLPQVIAIERRVFPTPWSLAMFVLEMSKQTGICLAAVSDGRLVGYLICSRYDTVWHVMNVAVDITEQRKGLASALLAELYARVGDERARFTLEVRRSNSVAIHLYEREDPQSDPLNLIPPARARPPASPRASRACATSRARPRRCPGSSAVAGPRRGTRRARRGRSPAGWSGAPRA